MVFRYDRDVSFCPSHVNAAPLQGQRFSAENLVHLTGHKIKTPSNDATDSKIHVFSKLYSINKVN